MSLLFKRGKSKPLAQRRIFLDFAAGLSSPTLLSETFKLTTCSYPQKTWQSQREIRRAGMLTSSLVVVMMTMMTMSSGGRSPHTFVHCSLKVHCTLKICQQLLASIGAHSDFSQDEKSWISSGWAVSVLRSGLHAPLLMENIILNPLPFLQFKISQQRRWSVYFVLINQ